MPGTVDHLVDDLIQKHDMVLPAVDVLSANPYELLMTDVVDAKDLGSGVVGGVECDHLAFRAKEVDWQIWIAQGSRPYPCKYVITTRDVAGEPQYSVQVRDWKTGSAVARDDFAFKAPANSKKVELSGFPGLNELPSNYVTGGSK